MTEALDFLGQTIQAGDLVVYPVRRRSEMWLRKLNVEAVVPHGDKWRLYGSNDTGHHVTIDNLGTCIVVSKGYKV